MFRHLGCCRALLVVLGFSLVASVAVVVGPAKSASAQSDVDTTMLLFDLSGSMARLEADGRTRLQTAQDAMISAIGGLESGSKNIGIRTFSDCQVSDLAAPPGPVDAAGLAAVISSFTVDDRTDISFALESAAGDLAGQPGRQSIILLSDGEQTCPGDPCATAQALVAAGIDVIIHAIGIGTAGTAAEQQLACIAGATGGTVVSVDNSAELFEAIDDAITGDATAGLIFAAIPTCITSPSVQSDSSLGAATVGTPYTDSAGVRRVLTTGAACGFYCEGGFDINCDGVLDDFCPAEFDANTVAGAGRCLEFFGDKADPTEEVDENGNPTMNAILAYVCTGDAELSSDMVAPCSHYGEGQSLEARADNARSVGDAFLADWNEKLAAAAFEEAERVLQAAIDRYLTGGRTFIEAVRRVVFGEDAPAIEFPELPNYRIWQSLPAYPLHSYNDDVRDVRVAFRHSNRVPTVPAPAISVFQSDDQVWDCDAADFEFDGERLRWTGPRESALYVSFLVEYDGAEPVEVDRTTARRPLALFREPLWPGREYAIAVVAESATANPEWLGTCVTYVGDHVETPGNAGKEISELGLENELIAGAGDTRTDAEYGVALELEYVRALGEGMTFEQFTQIAAENFDTISGGQGQFDQADARDALNDPALSDDVRAAAWRAREVFASLEVARDTNLKDRLGELRASFATEDGNGLASREDLAEFPFKFEALVMLAPWLVTIDAAGQTTGVGDILEGYRDISNDDVDAFLDQPIADDYIKYLAATVFERTFGGADWLDTQPRSLESRALVPPTRTLFRPGSITLSPSQPTPQTSVRPQPQQQPPGGPGVGPAVAVVGVLTVGVLGYKYLQAQASVPPSYITFVHPITGEQLSLRATTITDYPEELWPQVIDQIAEHILATGEVPEPDELVVLQPGTYADDNGQIRDRCTNEILQPGEEGCKSGPEERIPLDARECVDGRNGPETSGDEPAAPGFPSIDEILADPSKLPAQTNGAFARFFNSISNKDLRRLWDHVDAGGKRPIRTRISSKLLTPGEGLHEWLMRGHAPTLHCMGFTFEDIKELTTKIADLKFTIPQELLKPGEVLDGVHGGHGSNRFHRDLGAQIESSLDKGELKIRIDVLTERWKIDTDLVPPGLRVDES